jgi:phospholipase C
MGKLGNVRVHASAWVGVVAVAGLLALLAVGPITAVPARPKPARPTFRGLNKRRANDLATATPIKHLVVVFQENRSFDRYFGTYPRAVNPPGEPQFVPAPDTPTVNGLTSALLTHNPNLANPVRL